MTRRALISKEDGRIQARIQDFAQGGATANRGPRLGIPRTGAPRYPLSKKKKTADLVHYFLVGTR